MLDTSLYDLGVKDQTQDGFDSSLFEPIEEDDKDSGFDPSLFKPIEEQQNIPKVSWLPSPKIGNIPEPPPIPAGSYDVNNPPPIPPGNFAALPLQKVEHKGETFYMDPIEGPKRGLSQIGEGVKESYKALGLPIELAAGDEDAQKRDLLRKYIETLGEPEDLTNLEKIFRGGGNLAGTIIQLLPAMVLKSKKLASATFGMQGAGNAYYKAGLNALNEGYSVEDSLKFAKANAPIGATVNAVAAYGFPSGKASSLAGEAGQFAQMAGIGGAIPFLENVGERGAGLKTPLSQGVTPSAMLLTALHGVTRFGPPALSYLGNKLRQPLPGELPKISSQSKPPPIPEKAPAVEPAEAHIQLENLLEKPKVEPKPLTPAEQIVEQKRLQGELEGKAVEAPVEPAKPEVSEVQQQAAIRDRIKSTDPTMPAAILERLVKKEMAKLTGEKPAVKGATPEGTKNIESIRDITSSPEKFSESKLGTTEAWELGDKFKTKEDIAALKQFEKDFRAEATAKSKDPTLSPGTRAAWAKMPTVVNEIIQGATKPKESGLLQQHFAKKKLTEAGKQVVKIETPEGVVEAEFAGWQEGLPGKPAVPNVGYIKANGDISHGPLITGHKIVDKIPTFEEWNVSKGKGPAPADAFKEAEQLAADENLIFKAPKDPWPGAEWEFTYKGEGEARGGTFQMPKGATKAEIKARFDAVKHDFETKPQAGKLTETEKKTLAPKPGTLEDRLRAIEERYPVDTSKEAAAKPSELPKTPEPPATAESIGEPPKPPVQPPPLPPEGAPESLPSAIAKEPASDANFRLIVDSIPAVFRYFSEGMVERIGRSGGEQAKIAEPLLNRVISEQKGHYGSLTDVLDPALEAAGKMNKATKWINDFDKITDGAAIARGPEALEGKIKVPDFVKPLIEIARKANLRIGKMYEAVTEGFEATGAWQRNLTGFGYDLIRRGRGRVWERLAEGIAKANKKPIEDVKAMLSKMKETYDEPSPSVNSIEKVNQDFAREFPRAVTHVKVNTYLGAKWEPVLHSQLYSYLESAARRASHVRSFRGVFKTPEDIATMSKDVRAELDPSHQQDFDALIRGLQGHPSDNYGGLTILSPDQPPAATLKLFNQTVGNLMAKFVLSGQMMTQAGETLAGATPIFLGAPRYLKAMAKVKQLYTEMERTGSVNKVIYDMRTDPTRPILSKFRQAGNIISKGTAQQFLNELQEGLAAATARIVKEDILANRLSNWDKAMLPLTFEKMGFSRAQAADMIQGKQPHLLTEFERKAAAWMTSGNKAIAEGSRLGASRLFNSVFRFQQYAMARSNQLRKVWGGVGKASQEYYKNPSKENGMRLWRESRQFARFHTGATLQGALTSAVFALFYGGPSGLKILYNEAKDDKAKFLMESFLAATSGPLYLVMRGREYGGITGIGEQVVRSMFPYQIMRSFIDMAQGAGQFRDMLPKDRVGKFVQQKIPASRALSTGLSLVGLSWENQPLENSIKGFYRWRRDEMGKSTFKDETEAYKKRAYFRTHMRKAVNALKVGDIEGVKAEVAKAAQSPDLKPNSIVSSLNARKILKNPNLRDLGPDEIEKLRKRIGPEAVERLQRFDAMIDALIEMYQ